MFPYLRKNTITSNVNNFNNNPMPFPFTRQLDTMDCGPACLKMITDHHGRVEPNIIYQKCRKGDITQKSNDYTVAS